MNSPLTDRQIALFLFGAIVGYGILGLPKNVVENAGTGGWITLILATLLTMLLTYVIIYLGYTFRDQTLADYSQVLTGKLIAFIIVNLYALYFFCIFTFITRISSDVIKNTVLIKTPRWAIMLVYYLVAYYSITRGLSGVARLCELYGFFIIPISYLIHILIFSQGNLLNIRPLFVQEDLPQYLQAVFKLAIPFLGIEALMFVPVNPRSNPKVFQFAFIMIGIIGLFYILVVESCVSVIGPDDIIHYKDALIATMRRVDIPFLEFLRRLDGFVLSVWIMAVICTLSIFAYGTVFLLNQIFTRIRFNHLALAVTLLAFIVGQIPQTFFQVEQIMQWLAIVGGLTSIVIPLTLFLLIKVKRYDKNNV